ncbi:MAG: sodium:proton antiporter NhaD [Gammaproteobacteria bacterium]|nr:sodium:proton antiporter NhaD [Gammaproteobacteria bacterium]MDX5375103.1 sodium:proton antiporter NhaD [Gammaproteobacteria bacterium]
MSRLLRCLPLLLLLAAPAALAAEGGGALLDFTASTYGYLAVGIFVIAYLLVIAEDLIHLRKSKPVLVAAGLIWLLVGLAYQGSEAQAAMQGALEHNLLEYVELLLFLLAAMTFINTLEERGVFDALRAWLVTRGLSLRALFWITGLLAFSISPVADNLTTALVMGAVVMAVGGGRPKFVALACINIVVGANAGGAFSPFGDITTLMVWQRGILPFGDFFHLFLPALVNWFVPALFMSLAVEKGRPAPLKEAVRVKKGGFITIFLFVATIATAVSFHNQLHLPPMLGMMMGLGVLKVYGYFLRRHELRAGREADTLSGPDEVGFESNASELSRHYKPRQKPFDIFISMKRAEWDTLMFFYGVILCVGGLSTLGYLALVSEWMYHGLGATNANILVGLLSAVVDNIPVMFAVLSMTPDMSDGQWLLVTLTAGVGGSLLSVGSAAGVALMGQARGVYTFFAHLKWTWAIALGYAASIWVHFLVNARLM